MRQRSTVARSLLSEGFTLEQVQARARLASRGPEGLGHGLRLRAVERAGLRSAVRRLRGGASFVAGVLFETTSRVLLRIGFNPEEPFSTPADIVWTRDESDVRHKSSYIHGARFRIEDPEQRDRLLAILTSPDFAAPIVPGAPREAPGLSGVVRDLADELAELGDRIQNES